VGLGGGSAIDATKAVQVCLWHGLVSVDDLEPYRSGAPAGRARPIEPPVDAIRMIAVSTTLSAPRVHRHGRHHRQCHEHQADVHAPPDGATHRRAGPGGHLAHARGLLFSTAIRSVDHAVECWCSPMATPATEALSLQGLRLLARALPAIQAAPQDLRPRMEAELVAALIARLGQPGSLRAVGLREDQLDDLAQRALVYPPVQANPRPITQACDVRVQALAW
jgi:maleylacetate reductase